MRRLQLHQATCLLPPDTAMYKTPATGEGRSFHFAFPMAPAVSTRPPPALSGAPSTTSTTIARIQTFLKRQCPDGFDEQKAIAEFEQNALTGQNCGKELKAQIAVTLRKYMEAAASSPPPPPPPVLATAMPNREHSNASPTVHVGLEPTELAADLLLRLSDEHQGE